MIDIFTHILTPKYLEALDYTRSGKRKIFGENAREILKLPI
jgi:predicted TIM-barrel fold metal-dependent hydrolase